MRVFDLIVIALVGIFYCTSVSAGGHAKKNKTATAEMLTNTCVACHGEGGVSQGPAIPSIAGMTENYFIGAMLAFKYDDDPDGLEKAMSALYEDQKYEDAEALPRYSSIMGRIAKGYTLDEIKVMAGVFAQTKHVPVDQAFDKDQVSLGQNLHEEHCDKCHEDGGLSPEDDVGILAGQWTFYLKYTLSDYTEKRRSMPKKMKKALDELRKSKGEKGIESLLHYYASVK